MSDWAIYEPMQSSAPQQPQQLPTMMADRPMPQTQSSHDVQQEKQLNQQPHQLAGSKQQAHAPETKNVPLPTQPAQPSKWEDISEYENISDWVYIAIAVIIVELAVITLVRFFPDFFGKSLNLWYNRFKLSAVISDIFIILIGFVLSRYIYSEYIYPVYDWNPLYFTGATVGVQLVHDILFYLGIIKQLPQGHNAMIDVMKEYADGGGYKILGGDAAMVAGSSVLSMLLKSAPPHLTLAIGLLAVYSIPYVLETQNGYSTLS